MDLPRSVRLAIRRALFLGALVAAVAIGFAAQAWWRHPDLHPWHTVRLVNEFEAGPAAPGTLADYVAQEDRLFAELRRTIYAPPSGLPAAPLEPYGAGSLAAPIALDTPGNRTHELSQASPRGVAVMQSDSDGGHPKDRKQGSADAPLSCL